MSNKLTAFAALFIVLAPAAATQGSAEVSGSYSHLNSDAGDIGAVTARGTYFFNQYFGAEAEASVGVKEEDNSPLFGAPTKLDHSLAGFGVVRAPLSDRVELFGRVGYQSSEISADIPGGGSASVDIDGLAYGVGGKFFVTDRLGVRVDASRYEGGDYESDVFSIGGVFRF